MLFSSCIIVTYSSHGHHALLQLLLEHVQGVLEHLSDESYLSLIVVTEFIISVYGSWSRRKRKQRSKYEQVKYIITWSANTEIVSLGPLDSPQEFTCAVCTIWYWYNVQYYMCSTYLYCNYGLAEKFFSRRNVQLFTLIWHQKYYLTTFLHRRTKLCALFCLGLERRL